MTMLVFGAAGLRSMFASRNAVAFAGVAALFVVAAVVLERLLQLRLERRPLVVDGEE